MRNATTRTNLGRGPSVELWPSRSAWQCAGMVRSPFDPPPAVRIRGSPDVLDGGSVCGKGLSKGLTPRRGLMGLTGRFLRPWFILRGSERSDARLWVPTLRRRQRLSHGECLAKCRPVQFGSSLHQLSTPHAHSEIVSPPCSRSRLTANNSPRVRPSVDVRTLGSRVRQLASLVRPNLQVSRSVPCM